MTDDHKPPPRATESAEPAEADDRELEDVRDSERKFRKIFELSPEAIVILDKRGRVLESNDRVFDWLGYRPAEFLGQHMLTLPFLPWRSKLRVMRKFRARMRGEDVPPYELEFRTRSGGAAFGVVTATPVRTHRGSIVADLVMISDITAQKEAQEEIRRLTGLLPICAQCKKIRDDKGYWSRVEAYIEEHSDVQFTHGICPDCAKELYPRLGRRG